ncbi:hypothetical protein AB838_16370 [Rhodobacteraceae bacterium (ex Bugula neritina AB1)]|nr:hypothetical protein AB838_16370 [Rhodobacteraceae bacterium (ex Bugula neritina AB1)]
MRRAIFLIDGLVNGAGSIARSLIFVLMAVIGFEAVSRYFFGAPTTWAYDLSSWVLVFYVFLGGGYALLQDGFVRVDILFQALPGRVQFWLDASISTVLLICFCGSLIWYGGELALRSFALGEVSSSGGWRGPVWPAKFAVPLGALLVLLAWISHLAKRAALTGETE